jgi:hypothetical protein
VQLELDKEGARSSLFDRNRFQQRLFAASCQVEFLDFQDIGSRPLNDRCEGLI